MEAKIIAAWKNSGRAYIAISVEGAATSVGGLGVLASPTQTEYVGSVPISDLEGLSAAETKAALAAAAKDAFLLAQPSDAKPIPVSGTVALA